MIFAAAAVLWLSGLVSGCGGSAEMLPAGGETSHNYYDMEFHRGGRDARPENTLYAYQYALENGALTIECDMQLTADGQTFFRIIRR